MQRDYRADNIRFFLIFTVVYAHFLEYVAGDTAYWIYRLIYSFHIGALLFLTGYFAKFSPKKILLSLVWPYFILQTLYKLFQGNVLQNVESVKLTYTTPYWLLWYLMATIFYYLLIPMLQQKRHSERLLGFGLVLALSLLAGLDETVGYYLTLSRFFCYLPFFVAGYYAGHRPEPWPGPMEKKAKAGLLLVCLLFLFLAERRVLGDPELFRKNVLYGSYSYAREAYSWTDRALLHAIGFGWIIALFLLVPGKKIPVVSQIGRNTFPVFLFHGFAVRYLGKERIFQNMEGEALWLALLITAGVLLLLGNPVSAWICKWFFTGHWLTALTGKKKKQSSDRIQT